MKTMAELLPGEHAVIKFIDNKEIALKLMEMGCIPGEMVEISKKAPLGCPISISLGSDELSLRVEEAGHVMVELV
jgi:ferrous iron transport protein A